MLYDPETNTIIQSISQIRKIAGNVSLPRDMANLADSALRMMGLVRVKDTPPQAKAWQTITRTGVVQKNGHYETVYLVEDKALARCKNENLQSLAALRWQKETGGVEVNGVVILTDRESQSMLNGALVKVGRNPVTVIDWKTAEGWIELNKLQIESLAETVANHVQHCFSREKVLSAQILAAQTPQAVHEIDIAVGW